MLAFSGTPSDETELLGRARSIAGWPLGRIASAIGRPVPSDLSRAKGWIGRTIELALGATAGAKDEPDFPELGVELKTIPVGAGGEPRESTFLCSLTPNELVRSPWESSRVRRKLARVLWLPIEADPSIPIADRKAGSPILWSPDEREEQLLYGDWERFASLVAEGWLDAVTAHAGEALQIRPKAAHAGVRRTTLDPDGAPTLTLPRGFYLRARFTGSILRSRYLIIRRKTIR